MIFIGAPQLVQTKGDGRSTDCLPVIFVIGDVADRGWQGEDQVVVLDVQQIGLATFQPAPAGTALALRTVAVATGVVGNL